MGCICPVAERSAKSWWNGTATTEKRWPFPQIRRTRTRRSFLVLAASSGIERCAFAAKKLRWGYISGSKILLSSSAGVSSDFCLTRFEELVWAS